jgi:hypothetical protein
MEYKMIGTYFKGSLNGNLGIWGEVIETVYVTINECDFRFAWYKCKSSYKILVRLEVFQDSWELLKNPIFLKLSELHNKNFSADEICKFLDMNNLNITKS